MISDAELIPTYSIEEAEKRFPFLFADTNPLLYRKFDKVKNDLRVGEIKEQCTCDNLVKSRDGGFRCLDCGKPFPDY